MVLLVAPSIAWLFALLIALGINIVGGQYASGCLNRRPNSDENEQEQEHKHENGDNQQTVTNGNPIDSGPKNDEAANDDPTQQQLHGARSASKNRMAKQDNGDYESPSTTTTKTQIDKKYKNRDLETHEDDDSPFSATTTSLNNSGHPNKNSNWDDTEETTRRSTSSTKRLPYLDNVKTFLTALVVTFHVGCSFGGCGDRLWLLVLGFEDPSVPIWFERANHIFVVLCQSFFMPLFFFISAYFVPTSYQQRGPDVFLASKRRRLWVPVMVVTFGLVPACFALAQSVAGCEEIRYVPMPAHGWFLLWLLLLNWVYHTFCVYNSMLVRNSNINHSSSGNDGIEDALTRRDFPRTLERWACGITICGILMA
jgi:hypothetical protein